jgi:hypothetical protein
MNGDDCHPDLDEVEEGFETHATFQHVDHIGNRESCLLCGVNQPLNGTIYTLSSCTSSRTAAQSSNHFSSLCSIVVHNIVAAVGPLRRLSKVKRKRALRFGTEEDTHNGKQRSDCYTQTTNEDNHPPTAT